ncbi:MAG TPA: ATP-binding protein, partial [Thermoanaerobaculia bacterium]
AGGVAYLSGLLGVVPTPIHADHYAKIVADNAFMRRLISAGGKIAALGYADSFDVDTTLEKAEQILLQISTRRATRDFESLADVLREYLEAWSQQSSVSTSLSIDDTLHLRPGVELQLVRIIQEALANVRKHARANAAKVEIRRRNGHLLASITDDGLGFNTAQKARGDFPKFGLTTMRERAQGVGGTLDVTSEPGRGTTVTFELPLAEAE